jgi:hypothetical protein
VSIVDQKRQPACFHKNVVLSQVTVLFFKKKAKQIDESCFAPKQISGRCLYSIWDLIWYYLSDPFTEQLKPVMWCGLFYVWIDQTKRYSWKYWTLIRVINHRTNHNVFQVLLELMPGFQDVLSTMMVLTLLTSSFPTTSQTTQTLQTIARAKQTEYHTRKLL